MRLRSLILVTAAAAALFAGAAVPGSAAADVDDFDFSSWDATFDVGIDDEGRATLHVVETRVAEFPESDQNRGIVAGFPERYQGASLETTIISVRDESGDDVPFETEDDDGVLYVLTGNDDFVHGPTTYVIEYEMRDVILAASGTEVDEFYWDLLPLDSTQDIGSFHAEVRFDDGLAPHLTGDAACYQGGQGSTDTCVLSSTGNVFAVSATDLNAGEGVTVAIALEPGTVTQPAARLPNPTTDVLPYAVGGGVALLSAGGWFATSLMIRRRRRGTGIVVAQYDVPDAMPPLLASALIPGSKNPLTAQIIHLAVRGMLRLEDIPEEGEKKRRPRLRRLDAPIPDPIDQRALRALFGSDELGVVMKMPKNSKSFAGRVQKLLKSAPREAAQRGFTTKARSTVARIIQAVALLAFAVMVALLVSSIVMDRDSAGPLFFATLLCGVLVLISSVMAFSKHTVLTRDGALQLEYLEGVREFIRVAEEDRLRMLQSYTGAERRSDGGVDVIHVYERLLPYAILFGQEREWGTVLEHAYGQAHQEPGWIDGTGYGIALRVALLSSATRTSSTYSSPSSGSSSGFGGSAGGGFSGGGGGGGFSGGR
ncbi:DUF2207 domain-containing protein [Microbacterium aerolatum]|uniref:Membrane protein n=1 Tax=Microbacterium aerolatum TaxID=153731 RepID=A0A511AFL6_9MICO|nr:DUF2207 domain-containing protein [Microbacterium aerolatum]GEK85461.1 membrane protein [Microbacterium aerolatum]GGB31257.1 membrane protein [Microbacterium aerolatum]